MKKIFLLFLSAALLSMTASAENPNNVEYYAPADLNELPADFKEKIIRKRTPFIKSYWSYPPDILLCHDSGVSDTRLRKAMKYWERLGYEFGKIIIESNPSQCIDNDTRGLITILLFNNTIDIGPNLAVTKVYYNTKAKYILRAQIFISPYSAKKERVLEHEIGHALGWSHFNRRYHMMHENDREGGHDSMGLHVTCYNDQIADIINDLD